MKLILRSTVTGLRLEAEKVEVGVVMTVLGDRMVLSVEQVYALYNLATGDFPDPAPPIQWIPDTAQIKGE